MNVTKKLITAAALSLMSAVTWAEGKIVVFDPTGAVMGTTVAKARFEKFVKSADIAASKAKVDGLKADYEALQASIQKDSLTWSDEKKSEANRKVQSLVADIQFEQKKFQSAQQQLMQQLMQEIGPKIEPIVKQLVESEHIGMILDAKSVLMVAKPEFDLTPKVTELLNKAK